MNFAELAAAAESAPQFRWLTPGKVFSRECPLCAGELKIALIGGEAKAHCAGGCATEKLFAALQKEARGSSFAPSNESEESEPVESGDKGGDANESRRGAPADIAPPGATAGRAGRANPNTSDSSDGAAEQPQNQRQYGRRGSEGRMDFVDRMPPHNLEAEQSVLGAILLSNPALETAAEIIDSEKFYQERHREIFRSMAELAQTRTPIDAVTLTDALRNCGKLEMIGGAAYIAELAAMVPTSATIAHYARIVREKALKREFIARGTELILMGYNGISAEALMGEASRQLAPLFDGAVAGERYADRQAIDAFEAFEEMKAESREYSWEGLIRDGCTAVMSGLMSSGKSTLAMNLARGWALGVETLGRACRQSHTLVVVSPKEFEAWTNTIHFWGLRGSVFVIESTKAHFPNRGETVRWFEYTMEKHGCRTFVLDTLFDFFGMPPNVAGDANRIAMNEQTPLLELVRHRNYSGLITGHAPKSEAKAVDPRDPEESFAGHSAWTAQHRMRMAVRRKSQVNAIITGRGGYGDAGILKEEMLLFDEETRLLRLGGPFADYLGRAALPGVLDALRSAGWLSRADLEKATGKGKSWIKAGLREGLRPSDGGEAVIVKSGQNRSTRYALRGEPEEGSLL